MATNKIEFGFVSHLTIFVFFFIKLEFYPTFEKILKCLEMY